MPRDSFEDRRARVREDVDRTVGSYAKVARVYTRAVTDHTDAAVNYVKDLFDPDNEQSAADLVKDGLGLWIGCCRRQMKMWHDLCDAVHDGPDAEPAETAPEPEKPERGTSTRPAPAPFRIQLRVDAAAETTGIIRTPFRMEEFNIIVKQDLFLQGGSAIIPRTNVLLSDSDRSGGFLKVSVFGLRPFPLGTYVGLLTGPGGVVELTLIRS